MRKHKFLLFLILPFLFSCSSTSVYVNKNEDVVVAVEPDNHFEVISENPVKIKKGKTATFKIDFDNEYDFKSAGNASYSNGVLSLENVQYSQTIRIISVKVLTVYLNTPIDCHYTVVSQNPVKVESGEDANFEISFEDGYTYESSLYGNYKNGIYTIENVQQSLSVDLTAKLKGTIHVKLLNNSINGLTKIQDTYLNNDYFDSGDEVVIEALPHANKHFTCWSIDKPISEAMPYSFERILPLKVTDDITLVANYSEVEENSILYVGNGGTTKSGDGEVYYSHNIGNHIRVNTMQGSNCFYRDGYILDSWNTEQDGTGIRIGLGSRYKTQDTRITLYAQWRKETSDSEFKFELNPDNESYKVTSCLSKDEIIAIPNYYENYPVTVVGDHAFEDLQFSKLYLPENISVVEKDAFIDCFLFEEIHFFDSLDVINDDSFNNCKVARIYINANTDPKYTNSYQSLFARKIDLMLDCSTKKMILVGNSNTLYSIDGSVLSSSLDTDVISLGVQDGVGIAWEVACIDYYCHSDDNTIIFCSEFQADSVSYFTEHKFYAAECNYDLLTAIDFVKLPFKKVFKSYSTFVSLKQSASVVPYSSNEMGCDKNGCVKLLEEPYRDDDWYSSEVQIDLDFYSGNKFDWAKPILNNMPHSKILMSCCSFNKNCIKQSQREDFYSSYQKSIIDNIGFTVISKLSDYAFTGRAFTTDNYHLIYSYALTRTNSLITDYLNWEKTVIN